MDVSLKNLQCDDSASISMGALCVQPQGFLGQQANRDRFERCLAYLRSGATELYLNLSLTEQVSVPDLAYLVQLNRQVTALGASIKLVNLPSDLQPLLERLKLHELFECIEYSSYLNSIAYEQGLAINVPDALI